MTVIIASFYFGMWVDASTQPETDQVEPQTTGVSKGPELNAKNIAHLVNAERGKAALAPLKTDERLVESARKKCLDIATKDYWAHVAPDGTDPWSYITQSGYPYYTAGENLAMNYATPDAVIDGWMNSPTHRENIEKESFTDTGVAICTPIGPTKQVHGLIVVQHFGSLIE